VNAGSFKVKGREYSFVVVPSGEYMMGSDSGLPLEQPVHKVNIIKSFKVLETPVTQRLYLDVMGVNPSDCVNLEAPIESVTWYDAINFCEKLSESMGLKCRLPSEAEWEYFCRAGTATEFFFGADGKRAFDYAWYDMNSMDMIKPVKEKLPNNWGLYDVVGNVWEWCSDNYRCSYNPSENETKKKVIRGGAFDMDIFRLRSAYRSSEFPELPLRKIGFRIVIE
jgi:formylglycine-generating enzyme required for sulfatase activity